MNIKRIGIDLAKHVFQIHGVDYQDKAALRKQLRRNQMLVFFSQLPPCLIGMEACSSAHYWARELQKIGHTVKLIAPQFVKPYVKGNKNDANDAIPSPRKQSRMIADPPADSRALSPQSFLCLIVVRV